LVETAWGNERCRRERKDVVGALGAAMLCAEKGSRRYWYLGTKRDGREVTSRGWRERNRRGLPRRRVRERLREHSLADVTLVILIK
jgi:hypothetical protein